jgi:squalene-associated FAD-dependent desaturase
VDPALQRFHLMPRTIHVIGAGLAGLSAAVRLTECAQRVVVHEAAGFAGGRCRSYPDQTLGMVIDNGNHLVLSANRATLSYAATIGAQGRLVGPARAEFPFVDLATGERWTVRPNDGLAPWWIFDSTRRVPGTRALDYLAVAPLLWTPAGKSVGDRIRLRGPLYDRLIRPLLLAALNIEPGEGAATLAGAVIRETLAAGGRACRPLIARDGLSSALIDPAVAFLTGCGATVRFGHRLRALDRQADKIVALDFGEDSMKLGSDDAVILAVPPTVAAALVPGLQAPSEFRAIVNAHFRIEPPQDFPPMIGLINATVEWIFAFPGRLSVTISGADRLLDTPRETLADTIWREVASVARLPVELPPWQIVRERRATFAATPEQNAKRPEARTASRNLLLAGDWTATGLPATIESAIRSGNRAAGLVTQ